MGNNQTERKNEKAFAFLGSDNPAAIGKRLDQGYVPKINDSNVIGEVGKRLEILKTDIENLTNEIKTHDQCLFDKKQGRHLKLDWMQLSHDCNLKFIEEIRALHANIQQMADKCKEATEWFKRIYGASEKSSCSGALRKKKKNLKKNKKTSEMLKNCLIKFVVKKSGKSILQISFLSPIAKLKSIGRGIYVLQNQS